MKEKGRVEVYGSSDDLIEVGGDIREEFNPKEDEPAYLIFSDGTLLHVEYDSNGCWRVNRLQAGEAEMSKKEAEGPDGDYTDRVTLTGNLRWVIFGNQMVRAKKV